MFIVPPPPRYAVQSTPYNNPSQATMATTTTVESGNSIGHPTGAEYQLAVGEGTYVLREEIHLSVPPPHPQDGPTTNPNPLASTLTSATAGTKLSLCIVSPNKASPHMYKLNTGSTRSNLGTYSITESEKESRDSREFASNGRTSLSATPTFGKAPPFGMDNFLLIPLSGKEGLKRRKPKSSLMKSSSTYLSRVMVNDSLSKRLQDRDPEGIFVFSNVNRALHWLDLSAPSSSRADHLVKILFAKAHMLCHDTNQTTKSAGHLDVIMGSSTGDILWFEAYSQKYFRINKNGIINQAAVTDIRWLPGSETLFLAAHTDGTLIVYDKEREDAAFVPEDNRTHTPETIGIDNEHQPLHINKSVNSKNQKTNPVAAWRISNYRINGFSISPDSRHLAVVSEDGTLRIIDYLKEQLTDVYTSYYGGFTCVCWSPDGKYILTGGQDDLVSIWSLHERRLVARCSGHHSWVSWVAFDPWRCDQRNYRFGSVGEDRRLLLWDFSVGMLHRPKAATARHRGSVVSHAPNRARAESQATTRFRSNSNLTSSSEDEAAMLEHPVESRTTTAELPPVMSKIVDENHSMSWVGFDEDSIITACAEGHIRFYARPQEGVNSSQIDLTAPI